MLKGEEGKILDAMICQKAMHCMATLKLLLSPVLGTHSSGPAESDIVPFKSVESVNHTAAHIGEQEAELKGIAARLALLEQENAELKAKVETGETKNEVEEATENKKKR